eukprot:TRINITY_DN7444_c0_g1_i8.p1 TRINITY_DN7444_c0_g1~~TRINITY_DN7444_c0_g1_i8.p1  ORF type:complete len:318 (-),score=59.41 TRINITY_DN7444_c0_g1_i8:258-1211(-)
MMRVKLGIFIVTMLEGGGAEAEAQGVALLRAVSRLDKSRLSSAISHEMRQIAESKHEAAENYSVQVLALSPTARGDISSPELRKILCLLHEDSMADLAQVLRLRSYELVFAAAPEPGGLWIRSPSAGSPVTSDPHWASVSDPQWASESVNYLNSFVRNHTFYGILGFGQGSTFATYFLSVVRYFLSVVQPGTFQVALLFSGKLPHNHTGLMQSIDANSPFGGIKAFVFMGALDAHQPNGLTEEQATKFSSPVIVKSSAAGHHVPNKSDPQALAQVLGFLASSSPLVTTTTTTKTLRRSYVKLNFSAELSVTNPCHQA